MLLLFHLFSLIDAFLSLLSEVPAAALSNYLVHHTGCTTDFRTRLVDRERERGRERQAMSGTTPFPGGQLSFLLSDNNTTAPILVEVG